mmetsp:Transcript_12945/g.19399  ORF Transcript_12945/g.19399 Transcript_12945/m.19399 type:complete len:1102 (+) Transcript_12945:1-3306(+)
MGPSWCRDRSRKAGFRFCVGAGLVFAAVLLALRDNKNIFQASTSSVSVDDDIFWDNYLLAQPIQRVGHSSVRYLPHSMGFGQKSIRRFLNSHRSSIRHGVSNRVNPQTFRGGKVANTIALGSETNEITESIDTEWTLEKVRQTFLDFFASKEHSFVPSSPVVPLNDPTILFANAGMNQFKPVFLGQVDPSSPMYNLKRAANSQKCIRAGGKHNDLEDVGKDTYHHTFFEMLGSWSFADYFKEEAIAWAFELITDVYKLPTDRLYATYFGGDDALGLPPDTEARDLWLKYLPESRVLPYGKKDNFWEMGDVGPCGPCTELHFDRIGNRDASALVNQDDPNVIEIWNIVFMQYNRESATSLKPLPACHVDTGMGLERVASLLQGKISNYDTDAFSHLINALQKLTGAPRYEGRVIGDKDATQEEILRDTAYRVVSDHVRTLVFALADGAVPSNEGRGYVLRRILRRAVRFGQQILGAKKGFFSELADYVIEQYHGVYPELLKQKDQIKEIIEDEEGAFSSMVDRGVKHLNSLMETLKTGDKKIIPGSEAFYLYDTLGFPLDLTELMAEEQGFTVNTKEFQEFMDRQKQASREALAKHKLAGRGGGVSVALDTDQVAELRRGEVPTTIDDKKYDMDINPEAKVLNILDGATREFTQETVADNSDIVGVILDETPFYAESGGQIGDSGVLKTNSGAVLRVLDVTTHGGYIVHVCAVEEGKLSVGDEVICSVDYERRRLIAPNHTFTHVLNYWLRQILGENVDQKGSLVDQDKLRFDFSFKRALKSKEIGEVEEGVRSVIDANLGVSAATIPLDDAMKINGLRAVFGESYPDPVRVIAVGPKVGDMQLSPSEEKWSDYSVELCGGTHLSNTNEAESFVVTEETAIAKGIRRVVALTRNAAKNAISRGEVLSKELEKLESAPLKDVAPLISNMKDEIDQAEISASLKPLLRDRLGAISKKILEEKKKEMAARVDVRVAAALEAADKAINDKQSSLVFSVDLGLDAKLINKVVNAVAKAHPDLPFMAVSEEDKGSGGAVLCVSLLPKSAVEAGLTASEWNNAALEPWQPKGGGKPNSAQARAAACDDVGQVIETARAYAATKLMEIST